MRAGEEKEGRDDGRAEGREDERAQLGALPHRRDATRNDESCASF